MEMEVFRRLSNCRQLDELQKNGIYIGKRKTEQKAVLLFQLQTFYVEIWYLKYRSTIDEIVVSASLSMLDPYLNQLPVELYQEG